MNQAKKAEEYVERLFKDCESAQRTGEGWVYAPEDSKRDFLAGYEQGRADALRWSEYPKEKPEEGRDYIITFAHIDNDGNPEPTLELGHYSIGGHFDGWNIPAVTHWLPIQLPGDPK